MHICSAEHNHFPTEGYLSFDCPSIEGGGRFLIGGISFLIFVQGTEKQKETVSCDNIQMKAAP